MKNRQTYNIQFPIDTKVWICGIIMTHNENASTEEILDSERWHVDPMPYRVNGYKIFHKENDYKIRYSVIPFDYKLTTDIMIYDSHKMFLSLKEAEEFVKENPKPQ